MSALDPVTILNVDDYEGGRYARTRLLSHAGYTVLEAATGTEALSLARAVKPALVLLDVNLPDMSGFEVCRLIKADPQLTHTLVLHLSASAVGLHHKGAGFESGADSYLTEPIDPRELLANVRALLRLRKAEFALRETNLTLETLIGSLPLAVVATDLAGCVLSWNQAAERMFGWRADEIVGERHPIVPENRRIEFEEHQAEVLAGQSVTGLETQRQHRDGHLLDISMSAAPLRDAHGRITGRLAVLEDISERRQVQRQMARLFREAQEANHAKDEFLATLSHELRTPLNAILGWTRMLQRGEVPGDRQSHAVTVIERNTLAQMRLIEDLLDVSRIITGKLHVDSHPLNFVDVVQAAAEAIRPHAEAQQLSITVSVSTTPIMVEGDPARLQQVVSNLLSNAVKFTRAGKISLTVSADQDWVRVSVADTGSGIDPAFLPFVFDRFRQGHGGPTREQPGLGIGLAIVRHIVEAHGGTVAAHSAGKGLGSTFEIALPRSPARP